MGIQIIRARSQPEDLTKQIPSNFTQRAAHVQQIKCWTLCSFRCTKSGKLVLDFVCSCPFSMPMPGCWAVHPSSKDLDAEGKNNKSFEVLIGATSFCWEKWLKLVPQPDQRNPFDGRKFYFNFISFDSSKFSLGNVLCDASLF